MKLKIYIEGKKKKTELTNWDYKRAERKRGPVEGLHRLEKDGSNGKSNRSSMYRMWKLESEEK